MLNGEDGDVGEPGEVEERRAARAPTRQTVMSVKIMPPTRPGKKPRSTADVGYLVRTADVVVGVACVLVADAFDVELGCAAVVALGNLDVELDFMTVLP